MKAGFAKVQLNIKNEIRLTGFSDSRFTKSILDGIFAKAVILESKKKVKILFLTLDLLFIGKKLSEILQDNIYKLFGIPIENIILTATHTHSAPKTCEQFLDNIKINNVFFNEVIEKSCKAVKLALKYNSCVKAELYETQDYPAINRRLPVPWLLKLYPSYIQKKRCLNRPNRKTDSDKSCRAIKFIFKNKSYFWVLNAAAHATNYNGNKVSSDYPYYIEKNLISLSPRQLCKGSLFLQGWAGDQNCDSIKNINLSLNPISIFEKLLIKQTFNRSASKENLNSIGKKIAKSIIHAKKKETLNFNNFSIKSKKIILSLEDSQNINLHLKYFNLGRVKIFSLNGEVFASYRKRLINILNNVPSRCIFTLGYTEDPVGYIPDSKALSLGGYETDRSIKYFGLSSRFSKSIEQKIILGLTSIINNI